MQGQSEQIKNKFKNPHCFVLPLQIKKILTYIVKTAFICLPVAYCACAHKTKFVTVGTPRCEQSATACALAHIERRGKMMASEVATPETIGRHLT
jgi:hypothetical protein